MLDILPGEILTKRIVRESIQTPQYILFLTEPEGLEADILYILHSDDAPSVLPGCSAAAGATIICAGAIPSDIPFQVNINLITVACAQTELHNSVSVYLAKRQMDTSLDNERFRHHFAEIVDSTTMSDFQISDLCGTFPKRLKSSFCVICIQTPDTPDKVYENQVLRSELRKLFSDDNVTSYDNETIVIHSYDGFTHPPKLPIDELSALLKKRGAFAGVSNGIRKPSRLRLMYILAKKALESGQAISEPDKNIYFYDDTMLFSIASFAATNFRRQFETDDIIAFASPVLINIIKHDMNGKRDLLETLIQYIINGKSTSKTARAMHLHRNTVQNRIAIIVEIVGDQFIHDGMLQAKLLMTYYTMQFYKKIWNKDIIISPLCEGHENVVKLPNDR